jgi:hypothetical protein
VFGATAFSTYGTFWIGLGLYVLLAEGASANPWNDLGFILLAFAIFNTYMLLWSTRVSVAVFLVFLTLEATEIVLSIGFFTDSQGTVELGGMGSSRRGGLARRRRPRGMLRAVILPWAARSGSAPHPPRRRSARAAARPPVGEGAGLVAPAR